MPTRTRPTLSTSAQLEQNDASVSSSLYRKCRRKEVFCSYCERKDHKEVQCREKCYDAKQRKEARPNTVGSKVTTMNESGLSHRQAKEKNLAR